MTERAATATHCGGEKMCQHGFRNEMCERGRVMKVK
jgi:hypothetical protein